MSRNRVFVTRRIPEPGLSLLRGQGAVVRIGQANDEEGLDRATLIDGVRNADVLLCLLTEDIDREVLEANPALLGVANYAVGYDNIDIAAANALGLPVTNTPGVLTEATADFTWALLLAVARRIPEAHRYTVDGRFRIWGPQLFLGSDIGPGPDGERKTLGIVGYGRIGRAVARRAHGFDMDILVYDPLAADHIDETPGVHATPLPDLLHRSDFVTLHAALTPGARHLIGEPELRAMKRSAFLINAARGAIVDEHALLRALQEGRIAGAALDVYEREPEIAEGLTSLPNVVLAPHIASATVDTRARMATIAATNAIAHLRRERAPDCVNARVYDTDPYLQRIQTR